MSGIETCADIDGACMCVDRLCKTVTGFPEGTRRNPSVGFDLEIERPLPTLPQPVKWHRLRHRPVVNQFDAVERVV